MKTSVVLSSHRKFLNNFRLLSTVNSRKSFRFQKIFCFRKNLLFFFVENHRKKLLFFSSKFSNVFFSVPPSFLLSKIIEKILSSCVLWGTLKNICFSRPRNFLFCSQKHEKNHGFYQLKFLFVFSDFKNFRKFLVFENFLSIFIQLSRKRSIFPQTSKFKKFFISSVKKIYLFFEIQEKIFVFPFEFSTDFVFLPSFLLIFGWSFFGSQKNFIGSFVLDLEMIFYFRSKFSKKISFSFLKVFRTFSFRSNLYD